MDDRVTRRHEDEPDPDEAARHASAPVIGDDKPPSGMAGPSGGGYGTASGERLATNTTAGEASAEETAAASSEADWLRSAEGSSESRSDGGLVPDDDSATSRG